MDQLLPLLAQGVTALQNAPEPVQQILNAVATAAPNVESTVAQGIATIANDVSLLQTLFRATTILTEACTVVEQRKDVPQHLCAFASNAHQLLRSRLTALGADTGETDALGDRVQQLVASVQTQLPRQQQSEDETWPWWAYVLAIAFPLLLLVILVPAIVNKLRERGKKAPTEHQRQQPLLIESSSAAQMF